jgi:hypothetical protein
MPLVGEEADFHVELADEAGGFVVGGHGVVPIGGAGKTKTGREWRPGLRVQDAVGSGLTRRATWSTWWTSWSRGSWRLGAGPWGIFGAGGLAGKGRGWTGRGWGWAVCWACPAGLAG